MNRDIETGRFTKELPRQEVDQLGTSEREAYQAGMAARDDEIAQTAKAEQDLRNNDQLKQTLFKAASIVGTEPIAQPLFQMGLDVQLTDGSLTLIQQTEEGPEALYTLQKQEYSELQKLEALDTLCGQLDKLGESGRAAANSLRNTALRDSNNVVF